MGSTTDSYSQKEVRLSITPEENTTSDEIQAKKIDELQTGWSTKCCCASRVKFSDADSQESATNESGVSSGAHLINEIANVISDYRRESVLNTISEFEKKLLMVGMSEEFNAEGSDSEGSDEEESHMRRHSEFSPKPLTFCMVENRRATAPSNIQTKIIDQINIEINEDNTEELILDSNKTLE